MHQRELTVADLSGRDPSFEIEGHKFYEHPDLGGEADLVVVTPDGRIITDSEARDRDSAEEVLREGGYSLQVAHMLEFLHTPDPRRQGELAAQLRRDPPLHREIHDPYADR